MFCLVSKKCKGKKTEVEKYKGKKIEGRSGRKKKVKENKKIDLKLINYFVCCFKLILFILSLQYKN